MEDARFAKLKQLSTIIIAFAGIQLCFLITSTFIVLCGVCARYEMKRKKEAEGQVYESSDEEDERHFRESRHNRNR